MRIGKIIAYAIIVLLIVTALVIRYITYGWFGVGVTVLAAFIALQVVNFIDWLMRIK